MVKYKGRWLPKQFAEEWDARKDIMLEAFKNELEAQQDPQAQQQAQIMHFTQSLDQVPRRFQIGDH